MTDEPLTEKERAGLRAIMAAKKLAPVQCDCRWCGQPMMADRYQVAGNIRTYATCDKCRQDAEKARRQQEENDRLEIVALDREQFRKVCGITPKFQGVRFDTYDLEGLSNQLVKAKEKAVNYAENFPLETKGSGFESLILFSESSWGTGKTHLACSIAHRILDRWMGKPEYCPVKFISEPDLFMSITATYNYTLEERARMPSETDIIRRLIAVPLLIIDDMGKRKPTDPRFVQRILFSIINGRYDYEKPLVLTANLNPDGLGAYLGGGDGDEAILDRLIGMCGGSFLRMDGKSKRRVR